MEPTTGPPVSATPADEPSEVFTVPVTVGSHDDTAPAPEPAAPAGPVLDTPFNGALQPPEPPVAADDPINQGSLLDQVSEAMPTDEVFEPPPKAMSRRRLVGSGLLALGVIAGILLGVRTELMKSRVQSASLVGAAAQLQQQSLPLPDLGDELKVSSSSTGAGSAVTVNGSLVLAPGVQPSSPVAGQLYYSQTAHQMQYYDGTGFVALQGGVSTTNIYNSTTTVAGNTYITNSGATLQGPAGTLAMFDSTGKALAASALSQSGTSLITSAATILGINAGGLSFTTASSTTGPSGDVTIDVGSGVVNGTTIEDYTFEDGIDGLGGAPYGTAVAQSNVMAHSGSYSLAVPLTSSSWASVSSNDITVTPGHEYRLTAWVRAATAAAPVYMSVYFRSLNITSSAVNVNDSTGSWTKITSTFINPTGNTKVDLQFIYQKDANEMHYLDDVTLTDLNTFSGLGVNIGATNAQAVTIGNGGQAGDTTITGGVTGVKINDATGNVSISSGADTIIDGTSVILGGAAGAGNGVAIKPQADSTTAFTVQNASASTTLLNVDTVGSTVSLGVGSVASFGNTRIGNIGGCCNVGKLQASKFTTVGGGAISSISAFIGWGGTLPAPNNQFQLAIYADNGLGTAPGAYIASTAVSTLTPTTISTGGAWNTLPISATLSAGTTYWLAYWNNTNLNDSNNALSYSSPANGALYQSSATWGSGPDNGLPATYPAGALSAGLSYSMYASFSQAGPALVLGSGGLVTASGPVLFQDPTNSPTAFQVQDNVGNTILTADTSDSIVEVTSLAVSGHIITSGTAPVITAGAAACTSPTVGISGNDTSGVVTVTTGTGCASSGKLATITFASPFGAAPHIILTPGSAVSAGLNAYVDDSTISSTAFDIGTAGTPANATTYKWNYIVVQ